MADTPLLGEVVVTATQGSNSPVDDLSWRSLFDPRYVPIDPFAGQELLPDLSFLPPIAVLATEAAPAAEALATRTNPLAALAAAAVAIASRLPTWIENAVQLGGHNRTAPAVDSNVPTGSTSGSLGTLPELGEVVVTARDPAFVSTSVLASHLPLAPLPLFSFPGGGVGFGDAIFAPDPEPELAAPPIGKPPTAPPGAATPDFSWLGDEDLGPFDPPELLPRPPGIGSPVISDLPSRDLRPLLPFSWPDFLPQVLPDFAPQPISVPFAPFLPDFGPLAAPAPLPAPAPIPGPTALPTGFPFADPLALPIPTPTPRPLPTPTRLPFPNPFADPLGFAGPGGAPSAPPEPLTSPQPDPVGFAAGNCPPCTTTRDKKPKRKPRAPRKRCYRGTYEERSMSLTKQRKEEIPCLPS